MGTTHLETLTGEAESFAVESWALGGLFVGHDKRQLGFELYVGADAEVTQHVRIVMLAACVGTVRRGPEADLVHGETGSHYRIRDDRVDDTGVVSLRRAGRMHHISIGRGHKGVAVILLIDDLNIRVIARDTAELLRAFTLKPNVGYQPRFKK